MYGLYGDENCYGLELQVSEFTTVGISEHGKYLSQCLLLDLRVEESRVTRHAIAAGKVVLHETANVAAEGYPTTLQTQQLYNKIESVGI